METRVQCPERLNQDTGREMCDAVKKRGISEGESVVVHMFGGSEVVD